MKIGIYDPYLDDCGGGEKYMMTLASCLAASHEVNVFWNNQADLTRVSERFSIDLSKVRMAANIFSPRVSFLKRSRASTNYDSIIVLSDGSVPLVFSKKLFLHFQQPIPGKIDIKSKLKLARVFKIFCNSYFTKQFIDKRFGVKSIVVYPPVSLHPKKEKKENIILHVGRFRAANIGNTNYKKQDVMIDAFKKMVKRGLANWKFNLVIGLSEGDEPQFEELKIRAKGFPIEFYVNEPNDALWEHYSKAKIYWHASGYGEDFSTHPEMAEHFGISTVEAMGAGAVPVVFSAGGQKEIVEDNVSGMLWNSLSELAKKTLLLTSEDKIRSAMSSEAAARAKDFAGERFCDEIERLIEG